MNGRPSDYTEELAADICGKLAMGQPLVRICREESMPHVSTVYRWLVAKPAFRDMYARAREDQADTLADEIVDIADETPDIVTDDEKGVFMIDGAAIQRQRLRVDARKWVAAKLKPRKYGDRIAQEMSGPDGQPLQTSLTVEFVGTVPQQT